MLDYDPQGRLAALLSPGGARTLLHRGRAEARELLVRADAVLLLNRDDRGRPRALLGSWGTCISFGYGLLGLSHQPVKMTCSRWGAIRIGYDREYRLTTVSATGKGKVSLRYDRSGRLARVAYRGPNAAAVCELLLLTGWLFCLRAAGRESFQEKLVWFLCID